MARLRALAVKEDLQLGNSGGWKTAIQVVAPANHRVAIEEFACHPKGVANGDKHVKLRLVKQSSAGTGGAALTPSVLTPGAAEAVQTTFAAGGAYSAQPTVVSGSQQEFRTTHPQMPFADPSLGPDDRVMQGGERWGLQYTNDGGVDVQADFSIRIEE